MKRTLYLCSLALLCMACSGKPNTPPVKLIWEMGENGLPEGMYSNSFLLINTSNKPLDANWSIYYNQFHRAVKQTKGAAVRVESVKPNYFKLSPTDNYLPLAPGDTLHIPFLAMGGMIKEAQGPEGGYLIFYSDGKEDVPIELQIEVRPFNNTRQWNRPGKTELPYPSGERVYSDNLLFSQKTNSVVLEATDIFPSIKSIDKKSGFSVLDKSIMAGFDGNFTQEAQYLMEKLKQLHGVKVEKQNEESIRLIQLEDTSKLSNDEYYELNIADNKVCISAFTPHGAFNGVQTFLSMVKCKSFPVTLDNVSIKDYPDLLYRGLMLDVARNFTTKQNLLTLIDLMASYKINVLHLHLTDDEGWRLEIPGIEELTAVGAVRSHTLTEADCLYPNYSGGPFRTGNGTGFYSSDDFVEILRYAKKRHIKVIPEVDLPGHARAAIVAMRARYAKNIAKDPIIASQYLLSEVGDQSVYVSAQSYTDNVVNIGLPSAYAFVEKVTDEIVKMYATANAPLEAIHIGGDEVPRGAWEQSPECKQFMKKEKMAHVGELGSYFTNKVIDQLNKKGVKAVAWQEAGMNHDESVNAKHLGIVNMLYCWNTMPEWGADGIPYRLANAGYDVVLSNLSNFYFDLAYSKHPAEPGHQWAGFVNEYNSFAMLPYEVYRSTHRTLSGEPIDLFAASNGKPVLTEAGKLRIKGVQGQLFSETARGFGMVEYYLFPKMFGLVERGWNATPEWSNAATPELFKYNYEKALIRYNAKIWNKEIPRLVKEGVNFRLSQPGLKMVDGKLLANTAIQDAEIRYTLDGSEPTTQSTLWTSPISCPSPLVKAKNFYLGKQSVTTRSVE